MTTIITIILLAAGAAGWGMYLNSRADSRRKAILRERLSRLASSPVDPVLFKERFARSLAQAQRRAAASRQPDIQAELDSAVWESSREG